MENVNSLHIITNNIKRVQKKNKFIEYFKNKTGKNRILFLQETHVEGKWKDELSAPVFYSHGTSNFDYVLWKNIICVNTQTTDKHGWVVILDVTIDGSEYLLVNIYNANIESGQLNVLNDLSEQMKKVTITHGKQTFLADDFNLFFDSNLGAKGGKPILKEKSVVKMIELNEEYDIWYLIMWYLEN